MAMQELHIDFNCEDLQKAIELTPSEVRRIFAHVLRDQHVEEKCQVSVSLVSDAEMQAINKQWRAVDAPTDVISIECERPGDENLSEGEVVSLGDIFLSPSYIRVQAKRFDVTCRQEATLLIVHALLHLLGYDHKDEVQAQIMEALEDRLTEELAQSFIAL